MDGWGRFGSFSTKSVQKDGQQKLLFKKYSQSSPTEPFEKETMRNKKIHITI
jgi:hypothetical protein